jgi:hypothetical protein
MDTWKLRHNSVDSTSDGPSESRLASESDVHREIWENFAGDLANRVKCLGADLDPPF